MAAVASVNIPTCRWAQRKDCVYVTVDVPDVTDEVISVAEDKLSFKGTSKGAQYACEMELFAAISTEGSKYMVKPREVTFYLEKADADASSWPRLLKDKALNKRFCKIDFAKWVDSDEEDESNAINTDGMQGMGGMPGMGGPGGGAGGMDMEALQKMMAQMGAGGMGGGRGGGRRGGGRRGRR